MDFPEISYGSRQQLQDARATIRILFTKNKEVLSDVAALARDLKKTYEALDQYFTAYTEPFCRLCLNPCCVNRHGFPDFEDLVIFEAMGRRDTIFDYRAKETDVCQYLGKDGCMLPRCHRSYRCTWYLCDKVCERFAFDHSLAFRQFELLMENLVDGRKKILALFSSLCKH